MWWNLCSSNLLFSLQQGYILLLILGSLQIFITSCRHHHHHLSGWTWCHSVIILFSRMSHETLVFMWAQAEAGSPASKIKPITTNIIPVITDWGFRFFVEPAKKAWLSDLIVCGLFSRQEGWRLENEDPTDNNSPLMFKGVVFNEMKGAFVSWHSHKASKCIEYNIFINALFSPPRVLFGYKLSIKCKVNNSFFFNLFFFSISFFILKRNTLLSYDFFFLSFFLKKSIKTAWGSSHLQKPLTTA